jgi:hypothetical protein
MHPVQLTGNQIHHHAQHDAREAAIAVPGLRQD